MSKSYALTSLVTIFVVAQFVATCGESSSISSLSHRLKRLRSVYFAKAIRFRIFADLLTIKDITRSINIVSAVADASIAAVFVILLHRHRTGFPSTDTMLNRLIISTINTGLLTAGTAIACLVTNIAFPDTYLYILFYLMTSGREYTPV